MGVSLFFSFSCASGGFLCFWWWIWVAAAGFVYSCSENTVFSFWPSSLSVLGKGLRRARHCHWFSVPEVSQEHPGGMVVSRTPWRPGEMLAELIFRAAGEVCGQATPRRANTHACRAGGGRDDGGRQAPLGQGQGRHGDGAPKQFRPRETSFNSRSLALSRLLCSPAFA